MYEKLKIQSIIFNMSMVCFPGFSSHPATGLVSDIVWTYKSNQFEICKNPCMNRWFWIFCFFNNCMWMKIGFLPSAMDSVKAPSAVLLCLITLIECKNTSWNERQGCSIDFVLAETKPYTIEIMCKIFIALFVNKPCTCMGTSCLPSNSKHMKQPSSACKELISTPNHAA